MPLSGSFFAAPVLSLRLRRPVSFAVFHLLSVLEGGFISFHFMFPGVSPVTRSIGILRRILCLPTCVISFYITAAAGGMIPASICFPSMRLGGGSPWALPCTSSTAVFRKHFSSSRVYISSSGRNLAANQPQSTKRVCPSFALAAGHSTSTGVAGTMGLPFPVINKLQAMLFDVDGTLTDSDPLHYAAFRDMLQEEGYNGGVPITEEYFSKHISGGFNADIGRFLFPQWEESRQTKWLEDKEALFRKLAADRLQGKPGLAELADWIKKKNLRRAAVTNAPRANAEQMIAAVGLSDFFEYLVVGSECARGKPFPDPYLKALALLGVSSDRTVVFEDSPSGIKAAVDAELAVVGVISGNPESSLLKAGVAFAIHDFTDRALWSALGEPSTRT